jgi:hypothetical protein
MKPAREFRLGDCYFGQHATFWQNSCWNEQ